MDGSRRGHRKRWRPGAAASCAAVAGATALGLGVSTPSAHADVEYAPHGAWNGYRVYLSPATHASSGSRGECGLEENVNGWLAANNSAEGAFQGDHQNFRYRGYKVRIGTGTVASAIANSNSWGSDVHIPLHSNARSEGCGNTNRAVHGTWAIHEGNLFDQLLGQDVVQWVGEYDGGLGQRSPGTNDLLCHTQGCTSFDSLGEIRETDGVSSYVEVEFHSWNWGADYLAAANRWSWRLAAAVDDFLDYPS
jgi:hypothetical protein